MSSSGCREQRIGRLGSLLFIFRRESPWLRSDGTEDLPQMMASFSSLLTLRVSCTALVLPGSGPAGPVIHPGRPLLTQRLRRSRGADSDAALRGGGAAHRAVRVPGSRRQGSPSGDGDGSCVRYQAGQVPPVYKEQCGRWRRHSVAAEIDPSSSELI